jgi:hypothetical protein
MVIRHRRGAAALLLLLAAAACATGERTQAVQVETNDPDAEILIDEQFAGRGFALQHLDRYCDHHVLARNAIGTAEKTVVSVESTVQRGDRWAISCCCLGIPHLFIEWDASLSPTSVHLTLPLPPADPPQAGNGGR